MLLPRRDDRIRRTAGSWLPGDETVPARLRRRSAGRQSGFGRASASATSPCCNEPRCRHQASMSPMITAGPTRRGGLRLTRIQEYDAIDALSIGAACAPVSGRWRAAGMCWNGARSRQRPWLDARLGSHRHRPDGVKPPSSACVERRAPSQRQHPILTCASGCTTSTTLPTACCRLVDRRPRRRPAKILPDNAILVARHGPAACPTIRAPSCAVSVLRQGSASSHVAIVARAIGDPSRRRRRQRHRFRRDGRRHHRRRIGGRVGRSPRSTRRGRLKCRKSASGAPGGRKQYIAARHAGDTKDGTEVKLHMNAGLPSTCSMSRKPARRSACSAPNCSS